MKVAVLIPCYNEGTTISKVVSDFRAALPGAEIYVYDNNSSDSTKESAMSAGAIVHSEPMQGKGNVVRRMFADIEADTYVMVDGDATYHAASAPLMIERLFKEKLDMVVGNRLVKHEEGAFRAGHHVGNHLLTGFVAWLFTSRFNDILSGYRVFSRRFVKSFPAISTGFETETELTVHALALRLPVAEVDTPYFARPDGSSSKLRTYHDGFRILLTILLLLKEERPQFFFSAISLLLMAIALVLGIPIIVGWMETGLVPRFPTALLATGISLMAFLSLAAGVILDTVTRGRREIKRLHYLSIAAPARPGKLVFVSQEGGE